MRRRLAQLGRADRRTIDRLIAAAFIVVGETELLAQGPAS